MLAGYSASTEIHRAVCLGIDQVLGQLVSFHQVGSAVRVAIGPPLLNEVQGDGQTEFYSHLAKMP